jgi:hypothetical protein
LGAGLALAVFPAFSPARQTNSSSVVSVPLGTILPVQLSTPLSSAKNHDGNTIRGRLMQDVPVANGRMIPRGSKLLGKVVAVSRGAKGGEISFRFDALRIGPQTMPLITNLRAIAGFVEVNDAHLPTMSSGEGEVYHWLPTVQIGGDAVYGIGGPVTRGNNPDEVVGTETANGLLGQISRRDGTSCRGPLYGNTAPQALWVFSSDACGVYGLPGIAIAHAGRTDPLGLIVLLSANSKLELAGGTGMLLRVEKNAQD